MDKAIKGLVAMGCITALEIVALIQGVDGQIFSVVIAALAGLGGFVVGRKTKVEPSGSSP